MLKSVRSALYIDALSRKQIRCVFEYGCKRYLIAKDTNGDDLIFECKPNYYQGFKYVENDIPQSVFAFGETIIQLNLTDPAKYPLEGEWYRVKENAADGLRWKLKKINECKKTTTTVAVSFMLRLLVALIFAGAMHQFTINYTQGWLHFLFPDMGRVALKFTNCAVAYGGCAFAFLIFKRNRTMFGIFFNTLAPFCLIVVVGLLKCYRWTWILLPVYLLISYIPIKKWITWLDERKMTILSWLRTAWLALGLVLLILTALGHLNVYLYAGSASAEAEASAEEALAQHEKRCRDLNAEVWKDLGMQEKLDLLQAICDYECDFVLGCERVQVYAGMTENDSTWGQYTNHNRSFVINEELLKTGRPEDVLETALHETRHAYQYSLIDMYASLEAYIKAEHKNLFPFQQAKNFAKSFGNYFSSDDDFDKYYAQTTEKDSRSWSEKRVYKYYIIFMYPDI